jgi:hypothetical protein
MLVGLDSEPTVDIDKTGTMANQPFGCGYQVPHAYAKTDTGNNFVAVLVVDHIFDSLRARLRKVLRLDLYQVLYRGLL